MTKRIAYLRSPNTDEVLQKTGFLDEYAVLKPHFAEYGAELVAVHWGDPSINWKAFDWVIPKNAWDYFDRYNEFLQWMDAATQQGVSFRNNAMLIRWNSHKQYLLNMRDKGAAIAPCRMMTDPHKLPTIQHDLERHGRLLLKPAVSGGGKQTKVYGQSEYQACLDDGRAILHDTALIIQPYIPAIEDGEWSFFFFGGQFSHAIVKIPKAGDFRAHSLFGAHNMAVTPTAAQINAAHAFLDVLPDQPHYARVDGVYVDGELLLIELELIEPYLYFEHAPPDTPRKLAHALLSPEQ